MPDRWINPHGWGPQPEGSPDGWGAPSPTPSQKPEGGVRSFLRRHPLAFFGGILLVLVLIGAMVGGTDDTSDPTSQAAPADTSTHTLPTVARTEASSSTSPPTTAADVEVPKLVGMTTRTATNTLADRGLHWRATYRATSRYAPGTVISSPSRPEATCVRAPPSTWSSPKRRRLPHH
jgi:PASTA domain